MRRHLEQDAGSATLLALGLALVVFAVAGLAVDGTRAYLSRTRLQNLADAAALAAADRIDVHAYRKRSGSMTVVEVDSARETALRSLRGLSSDVRAVVISARDGVVVRLSVAVPTTFLGLIGVHELRVVADAKARPMVGSVPR
jgi:uncharacterized membrane protein